VKPRDIALILIALGIFAVTGFVAFTQFQPQTGAKGIEVEVVTPIKSSFNAQALILIDDPTHVQDFAVPLDLTGLGNTTPFGRN
jgi:hypothetical protein